MGDTKIQTFLTQKFRAVIKLKLKITENTNLFQNLPLYLLFEI